MAQLFTSTARIAACLVALALPALAQTGPAPGIEAPAAPAAPASDSAPTTPQAEAALPGAAAPGALNADAPAVATPAAKAPAERPLPHELSPWRMFMDADIIVKAVMASLAFATFLCFTVLVYKAAELTLARARLRSALAHLRAAQTLPEAAAAFGARRDPAAFMAQAALEELRRSEAALDAAGPDGVKERTRSILERTEAQAGRHLMRGTGLLATIGSTAPFVGLFGTVWGIMNAFIGISQGQTTNLAVVAPGIAEALLATAIGLVAAIPAVVIYNHFARAITGYRQALADAAAAVERLLSRDLDFRKLASGG
ncbi:hypothetical protein MASR2M74_12940 [Paracoccaceae bacterium]